MIGVICRLLQSSKLVEGGLVFFCGGNVEFVSASYSGGRASFPCN